MPSRGITHGSGRVSTYDPTLQTFAESELWRTCPMLEILHDPSLATVLDEQFHSYDAEATVGDYVLTQATAGSAAISTTAPGTLSIDSGSTTATHGAQIQRVKSTFLPAAGKHIWAEFRVSFTGVSNLNVETFIGLAEIDTTIIGTSAVSTDNHIGFSSVTDDGILLFNCEKATAGATTTGVTVASATVYRLGFYVNGVTSAQGYVNGVATGDLIATANVPILRLAPSFVCQSGGTDQPVLHLHGYRIVQLR